MPTLIPSTATGLLLCGYAAENLNGINIIIMYGWIKMFVSAILILFWQADKDVIEEAYPGDVVGLV